MIGKLIKHEFRNHWLEMVIICGAVIVLSLITSVMFLIKAYEFAALLLVATFILYSIAIVVLIIIIVKSFNSNIFGDEGYLTLTLPTSIDSILISKIIVSLIWMVFIGLTFFISIIIFIGINSDQINFMFWGELINGIYNNLDIVSITFVAIIIQSLLAVIILIFTLSILNIGKIKRFKFIFGVIIYYFTSVIINWITTLVFIIPYSIVTGEKGIEIVKVEYGWNNMIFSQYSVLSFNTLFWSTIAIIGFYFLSRYLIKNKLELE